MAHAKGSMARLPWLPRRRRDHQHARATRAGQSRLARAQRGIGIVAAQPGQLLDVESLAHGIVQAGPLERHQPLRLQHGGRQRGVDPARCGLPGIQQGTRFPQARQRLAIIASAGERSLPADCAQPASPGFCAGFDLVGERELAGRAVVAGRNRQDRQQREHAGKQEGGAQVHGCTMLCTTARTAGERPKPTAVMRSRGKAGRPSSSTGPSSSSSAT
ncbi:hypothetical protein D3C81_792040 [compost metagenome]